MKLEYALEVKDGKIRTEEELTPARRWSFLIGRHEGSHTVRSRFLKLLQDVQKPVLHELENAFNIESVTDEFFKKYCELFFRMKDSLDKLIEQSSTIREDFTARELTSVDFAKKTLGQMAFLYFLQKKGWFGVAPGKPWGTGPKDFLRQLFTRKEKYGQNFFDDVLEPLFYEALAQDRGVEAIYPRLNNCRMPFLNGGLFEPMNGYSWETTNIRLPDELFSNTNRTPEGDEGDGILDIFDRYNFTVNENEPLEKEVAVDPEMLGKVFENLLEVKDRKSKGTFYTPREIVHFMCQESLIAFLCTEIKGNVPRVDIEALIRNGSQIIQNDAMVLEKGREGTYRFMLPETVRSRVAELDRALENIKVCDPAVGSGAFPLGMLNEIVQARQALAVHLRRDRSIFELKLHSISHSLYGVDIDPGAVEIAKLRLWLALVVEEDEPHPLPNLEHKIMQGNSLISEYEGVKLFDESFLEEANHQEKERLHVDARLSELQREYFALHNEDALSPVRKEELEREIRLFAKRKKAINTPSALMGQELSIFDAPGKFQKEQEKADLLRKKIDRYISESQRTKKQQLKIEIEQLKWELIEATLKSQGKLEKLRSIEKLRRKNQKPFFIWKLEFSDVFQGGGGFDVVIGNPPYTQVEDASEYKHFELSAKRLANTYAYFMEVAFSLMKSGAEVCFIVPNTWLSIDSCERLREYIVTNCSLRIVMETFQIFKSMGPTPLVVDTVVYLLSSKGSVHERTSFIQLEQSGDIDHRLAQVASRSWKEQSRDYGVFSKENKYKLIIDDDIFQAQFSELDSGKYSDFDVRIGCQEYALGGGMPPQTRDMMKEKIYHSDKRLDESYHRYVPCGDIQRYGLRDSKSFLKWGDNLHCPRDARIFSQEHLLVSRIYDKKSKRLKATYVPECGGDMLINNTDSFNIIANGGQGYSLKIILAILNSSFAGYYLEESNINLKRAVYPKINTKDLKRLPIPILSRELQEQILALAEEAIALGQDRITGISKDTKKLEVVIQKIDALVLDAYEVSPGIREILEQTKSVP